MRGEVKPYELPTLSEKVDDIEEPEDEAEDEDAVDDETPPPVAKTTARQIKVTPSTPTPAAPMMTVSKASNQTSNTTVRGQKSTSRNRPPTSRANKSKHSNLTTTTTKHTTFHR